MPEVGGTVSTSFAIRSINSDVTSGQDAARTVANNAINAVDDVLDSLRNEGGTALEDALAAITALGDFAPGSISFSYQIPDYLPTEFALPAKFVASTTQLEVVEPNTGIFSLAFSAPQLADTEGAAPPQFVEQFVAPPTSQLAVGFPVEPITSELVVGNAPELGSAPDTTIDTVVLPDLVELSIPSLSMPDLPTYEAVVVEDSVSLEMLPAIGALNIGLTGYDRRYEPKNFWSEIGTDRVRTFEREKGSPTAFFWRDLSAPREVQLGTDAWSARGWKLDTETALAQRDYRTNTARLAATRERNLSLDRQIELDRVKLWKEAEERVKTKISDWQLNFVLFAELKYQISAFTITAAMEVFRSLTALYNAKMAQFNLEVMQYKAALSSAVGKLEQWKVITKSEISKASLNDTLARLYSSSVDAEAAAASLYEAQVRVLGAEVDAYKTRMEAFATQADVARTKLGVYKGTVDAYIGSLAGYKAQFAQYEARMKGTAAENRVEEAKTQVSVAQIAAASANSMQAGVAMEVESASLRLQSRAQGALYDNQKLLNSLETIKAQIAADTAKQSIAEWSANIQLTNVENDAIGTEAQAAARYFQVASDSAYRASEQAMRAMLSASQAANIAQESGSRAAASIAQGAYSAMHVNASLTGSGRISGDENQDARQSSVISDFLDYSEDYQQILSA